MGSRGRYNKCRGQYIFAIVANSEMVTKIVPIPVNFLNAP